MKKITLLFAFLCFSLLANAQATCNQTFTESGQDDGPTVLTINAADIICNGANAVTSMQLTNSADNLNSNFCTTNGTSWYGFNLSIDGAPAVPVCDGEINGTDITGFTTLTITSQDNDSFSDGVTITIDVEVTYTVTTPPICDATLTAPANGATDAPIDGNITWSAAAGGATGYNLTVGTTSGGSEILATTDVGNVLTYALGGLTASTDYYVTIEPYNANGPATSCTEQMFTTYTPLAGDDCSIALPIACGDNVSGTTVGATNSGAPGASCGTSAGAPGIWYSFMGNGDIVTASLCGSSYDTKIQVYNGDCGTLNCVTGNDDSCGLQSEVLFVSSPGVQYYIYVFGFSSSVGNYTLDISCATPPPPPANDDCVDAIGLTINEDLNCGVTTSGTISGATASIETSPSCFGTADDDVWYSFTATSNMHVVSLLNIAGSTTNVDFSVFEGACGALTEVFCESSSSDAVPGLTIGNTYYVRVYSNTGNPLQDSTFDVCVGTPPPPITTDITTYTPEQLIEDVLIDADCATVTNIQYETHSTGNDIGFSYFTDGGSSFPFENGIILSSGAAIEAAGPFSNGPSHSGNGFGDADLEAITGITDTHDRVYLEFDFVPLAPQISFNYLMASSEYNGSFECTFADSFAFILTHVPSGTVTNLAKLPAPTNGNDNVIVTNIRPEISASCPAQNEHYFGGYTQPNGEIAYGGRTVPLTAFSNVIAGDLYHIKLVMADQADSVLDTAIFLEGGSFSLGSVDLGDDVFLGDPEALCEGDVTTLNAGVLPNGTEIKWFKDGVEVTGSTMVNPTTMETEQILNIDSTGDYSMSIYFTLAPECSREDEVHIEFYPNPAPDLGNSVIKCANEALVLNANVGNLTDPNMSLPLDYVWEYRPNATSAWLTISGATPDTYTIEATTVITSTNSSAGTVQYNHPVTGVVAYGNVVNNVYELGDFRVTATDLVTGCSGTSEIHVDFYENANCMDLPTGLSPNGDGVNDCLIFDDLETLQGISKFQVFNRYGTKVYENGSYIKEWCGTNNDGDELKNGTYYYILEFEDGRSPIRSWIYINTKN
ncbi:MAG: choice-of-anchor L domain-containing protein [Flavobacteriaceae bacterium]